MNSLALISDQAQQIRVRMWGLLKKEPDTMVNNLSLKVMWLLNNNFKHIMETNSSIIIQTTTITTSIDISYFICSYLFDHRLIAILMSSA